VTWEVYSKEILPSMPFGRRLKDRFAYLKINFAFSILKIWYYFLEKLSIIKQD